MGPFGPCGPFWAPKAPEALLVPKTELFWFQTFLIVSVIFIISNIEPLSWGWPGSFGRSGSGVRVRGVRDRDRGFGIGGSGSGSGADGKNAPPPPRQHSMILSPKRRLAQGDLTTGKKSVAMNLLLPTLFYHFLISILALGW